MSPRVVWVVVVLVGGVFAGCRLPPRKFTFNAERAHRYVLAHEELSNDVAAALLRGTVVPGMSEREVRLCMGPPRDKKRVPYGAGERVIWNYVRPARQRGDLERSEMWHRDIPIARVVFGPDGRVIHCQYFGRRPPQSPGRSSEQRVTGGGSDRMPPAPAGERPGAVDGGVPWSAPEVFDGPPSESSSPAPARRVTRQPKGEFNEWPELDLSGVSSGGSQATAIINRSVVLKGDRVAGVEVLDVTPVGVLLKYGDDIQFLPVGETTR
jgi:hypothetical protein